MILLVPVFILVHRYYRQITIICKDKMRPSGTNLQIARISTVAAEQNNLFYCALLFAMGC